MSGMGGMPLGDVLPELVLLGGAVIILIFVLFAPRNRQAWAAAIALLTLVLAGITTIDLLGAERLTFAGTYAVDGSALWAKLIVLAVTVIVIALSVDWFRSDPRHGEYYTLLLMSALGAALLAGAADLIELTLAVLLSSATGYVLVAYHRLSRRAAEASIKYYLLGALANGAMVYGVVLLFGLAATTTFSGLLDRLANLGGAREAIPLVAGVALVVVGLAFKMGAVPAHAWMPDVADGAPAPVAAFVTAAPKVGALVALARLCMVLPESMSGWRPLVAVLAAATMTLGNVAALWQDDVRRLLGWSAVSQSGYALMAVVALGRSQLALPALIYFLAAYVLGNLAAFGVVIELRGESGRARYAGLARTHPWLALALTISFLSFIGIPPLAGFAGKLALFGAAIDAGYGWIAVLAAANSVVSLAYYARVLGPMYFGGMASRAGELPSPPEPLPVLGAWALAGLSACAIGVVALGIAADWIFRAVQSARILPG